MKRRVALLYLFSILGFSTSSNAQDASLLQDYQTLEFQRQFDETTLQLKQQQIQQDQERQNQLMYNQMLQQKNEKNLNNLNQPLYKR